jgi:hypothetical protein
MALGEREWSVQIYLDFRSLLFLIGRSTPLSTLETARLRRACFCVLRAINFHLPLSAAQENLDTLVHNGPTARCVIVGDQKIRCMQAHKNFLKRLQYELLIREPTSSQCA